MLPPHEDTQAGNFLGPAAARACRRSEGAHCLLAPLRNLRAQLERSGPISGDEQVAEAGLPVRRAEWALDSSGYRWLCPQLPAGDRLGPARSMTLIGDEVASG